MNRDLAIEFAFRILLFKLFGPKFVLFLQMLNLLKSIIMRLQLRQEAKAGTILSII
jgi:hypothetical protein